MRIADRRGRATGQHAAVELLGTTSVLSQCTWLSMKPWNRDAAAGVDLTHSAVAVAGAHDHLTADRDITRMEHTGRKIEDACVAHDQVRRHAAHRLIDPTFQDLSHALSAFCHILADCTRSDPAIGCNEYVRAAVNVIRRMLARSCSTK